MREVDAAVDHRAAGHSDERTVHAERERGCESEFRRPFADPEPGDWIHLSELQSDRRSYGCRECRTAVDVQGGNACCGAEEAGAGVAGAREYGAPDAALSGSTLGRSTAEGCSSASAGGFAVDSAGR